MKKIVAGLISAFLVFGLVACGSNQGTLNISIDGQKTEKTAESTAENMI